MKIKPAEAVEARTVEQEGARGVRMRMLIGPDDEAPNFNMRMFEVDPGGHTPRHRHPWEHEVYLLAGEALVRQGDEEHRVAAGDCIYIPPDEEHQFANVGRGILKFLCLVPRV